MKKIKIFDTTLRDGEQAPGASLNPEQKLEIAKQLARLGVDVIEAGFAISSEGDFESIKKIAQTVKGPSICSLARTRKQDIDRAWEAVKYSKKPRIHTFIATSQIHMEKKLRKSAKEVLEIIKEMVSHACSLCNDVEFSAEDAGRSDPKFLYKVVQAAIEAGAKTVNIPDTVGYTMPDEFGELIAGIMKNVPNVKKADISVHCHNDLGLAVANSIAAIMNGATQVECTINGIGERAGNASLEEIVMGIMTRKAFFNAETNINTKEIYKTSRLVSNMTGMIVQPNKAIVGGNAFAHEAGIHQDGIIKEKRTYEIMDAESVGITESKLVLGKHSGRNAFTKKLTELGFELKKEEIEKAFTEFKALADKKKDIADRDIEALISDEILIVPEACKLESLDIHTGTIAPPKATVTLTFKGSTLEATEIGDGPVDAIYTAITKLTKVKVSLVDYIIQAITGGTDALGEVTIRIKDEEGRIYAGHGSSTDILVSSAKAYINAINKMIYQKEPPTTVQL
ncbi:2-isopropylmalate synthase [Candidatus Margulisiibacteriota bacterium]